MERLRRLRDTEPDKFEQLADLAQLVALRSYEARRKQAVAAGAEIVNDGGSAA